MLTLFRTTATHDWKGRPSHTLTMLGTGTREELLALQDKDVEAWQADDIENDKQMAIDDAKEAGEPEPRPVQPGWYRSDERWEMDLKSQKDWNGLRAFTGVIGESDYWSTVYHILDTDAKQGDGNASTTG